MYNLRQDSQNCSHCLPRGMNKCIRSSHGTENGREFVNQHFRSLAKKKGIFDKTTGAERPWSNGVCERHNAILTEMFLQLRQDDDCTMVEATLIKHCCYAKNSQYNKKGFIPYQLIFGQNSRLSSVVDCQVPATENLATTEVISRHLSLLNKSCAEFFRAEGRIITYQTGSVS